MKILAITSAIDLKLKLGCTPAWWQLFKALYELGHEIIAVPWNGEAIETLWWRTYDNPTLKINMFSPKVAHAGEKLIVSNSLFTKLSGKAIKIYNWTKQSYLQPKWKAYLDEILSKEANVDVVIFMSIPLNCISNLSLWIKGKFNIPVLYFEGDMPVVLPKYYKEYRSVDTHYLNTDLSPYDAFISNSEGVVSDLREMGAQDVYVLHYGVDPDLYAPINVEKQDIDISYYGHGSASREDRMNFMITQPSRILTEINFVVGGGSFDIDLGLAKLYGHIPFSSWRRFCCKSKINLSVTRGPHATVYASSNSRIFELAAMGCCVVSDPYNGLEKWFDIGKEVFMVQNIEEAVEIYKWLLSSEEARHQAGELARKRVLREHTFRHRAKELIEIINKIK